MKILLVSLVLASMSLSAITLSVAQSNPASVPKMAMHDNMTMESSGHHENMAGMAELMMRIGNTLEKHKMTAEQHIECAKFMNKLGKIMMNCAADVELKAVNQNKDNIDKITKEWNYFESENFEDH